MHVADLLVDAFGRIRQEVHAAVRGLTADELVWRADAEANSVAWLVWHLTRIQDDHVSDVAGAGQVWSHSGWADRFDLPLRVEDTGYGHRTDEVAAVRVASPHLLTGYHDAVHARTIGYVSRLRDADLDRIVDTSWDPPVSLGVRLISVVNDDAQHAGQALLLRGLLLRRRR
ncbi:mycothiol transferase [Myceligenerans indicum]|uniref:DinB family protein n=1 Tax=Myceligenerans indicum TaxID=2593663 RepID=A0ABS1LIF5_9MICO|nr:DinB family protein [Myceligenerans indicum]MBL0886025.1 DinB family protein [Myceligenerans indicum]